MKNEGREKQASRTSEEKKQTKRIGGRVKVILKNEVRGKIRFKNKKRVTGKKRRGGEEED